MKAEAVCCLCKHRVDLGRPDTNLEPPRPCPACGYFTMVIEFTPVAKVTVSVGDSNDNTPIAPGAPVFRFTVPKEKP